MAAPMAEVSRLTGTAFGEEVEAQVLGLPEEARTVLGEAMAAVRQVERLVEPTGEMVGGVAELNATAGGGPRPVDPVLLALLSRAGDFCVWSDRAHGPLGGELYGLWGLRGGVTALPDAESLARAAAAAGCDRMSIDRAAGTAALAAGSRLDVREFAAGHAADRAVEVLRGRGATSGLVRVGPVWRGFGAGPEGKGWRVTLPMFAGMVEPLAPIWLRDRSLAVIDAGARPLTIGGETFAPFIHQRTGRPAQGALAVVAVSELGVDAQGVAVTMLLTGAREGQLRLGSLRPHPSALWVLGTGAGPPLLVDHRWAQVPKR